MLPLGLLYLFSDFLYLIIYRVVGYRKAVVRENLRQSFPAQTQSDLLRIEKKFYRYFCDLVLETLKTLVISPRRLDRMVQFENTELLERYHMEGQSIALVLGHQGNWELVGAAYSQLGFHPLYVIYHPLSNPHYDRLLRHMRTRLGNGLYSVKTVLRDMVSRRDTVTATAFIADQTPQPDRAHWMEFLSQDTPVFRGTAILSRRLKLPLIYVSVTRSERGKYLVKLEELASEPSRLEEDELTELHTRRLEVDIRAHPELWLWTHRRWKHQRTAI